MQSLLSIDNVSKQFASLKALDRVSLNVPKGSIYGLLGPNGAGKTTLIRIINQITGPDSGTIRLGDIPLNRNHIYNIGYLPEERGLYKKMKVGEQALYLAQLKGLSKHDALTRLKEWFRKFEIENWWNRRVEELSKGMQQKVQFIVTVVHQPELLIFDEPFSGFDPINVNLIKDEILKLRKDGATIIFSTHNMASVEELCDQIALIDRSKKILEGNISDIKEANRTFEYELSYESRSVELQDVAGPDCDILSVEHKEKLSVARIKIPGPDSKKKLLETLMQKTDLIAFTERFPSINDIFISKVKENEKNPLRDE